MGPMLASAVEPVKDPHAGYTDCMTVSTPQGAVEDARPRHLLCACELRRQHSNRAERQKVD